MFEMPTLIHTIPQLDSMQTKGMRTESERFLPTALLEEKTRLLIVAQNPVMTSQAYTYSSRPPTPPTPPTTTIIVRTYLLLLASRRCFGVGVRD